MPQTLAKANRVINLMSEIIEEKPLTNYSGKIYTGVDLGTANIVVTVLDQVRKPLAGALYPAKVVKDGLVVDYIGAVQIVRRLVSQVEETLGFSLEKAATAIPPGTRPGDTRAIVNVVEAADLEVTEVVDEPTAAASVLGITDGAVVDVGGGTTGISILKNGEVIYTADEPTGGTHFNLVLAGHYGIDFDEAEQMKRDPAKQQDVFPIVLPVIQKVAAIVNYHLQKYPVEEIYLVGGTCCLDGFESVVEKETGIKTIKPANPLLVTPLGIAMHCK